MWLGEYDVLIVRSDTPLTKSSLIVQKQLKVVGMAKYRSEPYRYGICKGKRG